MIHEIFIRIILIDGAIKIVHKGNASGRTGGILLDHIGRQYVPAVSLDIAADVFSIFIDSVSIGRGKHNNTDIGVILLDQLYARLQVAGKLHNIGGILITVHSMAGQVVAGIVHDSDDIHRIQIYTFQSVIDIHCFGRGICSQCLHAGSECVVQTVIHGEKKEPVEIENVHGIFFRI